MPHAILFDILQQIQSSIQSRALPGLGSAQVLIQKVPGNRPADLPTQQFPCIVIAPSGAEQLDPLAGTTTRDDVVYRVLIAILAADEGDQSAQFNLYLSWRQSLRQLFHDQPLADLCFRVQVQPLDIVDREAWLHGALYVSRLLLNCYSREPRG
ncbi:MAG: hypothetical protein JSS02_27175 [Planctomycetes bacterium]|nr:hypothetical protein [Planctomycetota bacterium]